jgi:MYXO-CTERM domain-containing protein
MRPSGVPFIHALDTTHQRAVCIDLRPLANSDVSNAHLVLLPGGTTLRVDTDGASQVSIDTRTFRVSAGAGHSAAAPVRSPARGHRATPSPSGIPWEAILVSIAALGVVAAGGAGAARRRRHPDYARGPDGTAIIHVDARPTDRATADDDVPVA